MRGRCENIAAENPTALAETVVPGLALSRLSEIFCNTIQKAIRKSESPTWIFFFLLGNRGDGGDGVCGALCCYLELMLRCTEWSEGKW